MFCYMPERARGSLFLVRSPTLIVSYMLHTDTRAAFSVFCKQQPAEQSMLLCVSRACLGRVCP